MSKYKGLAIGSVLLVLLAVLTITPSASAIELNSICGGKFNDKNNNGKLDDSEEGLAGWTIYLTGVATFATVPIPVVISTKTIDGGAFCFSVPKGKYSIFESPTPPPSIGGVWMQTTKPTIIEVDLREVVPPVVVDLLPFGNRKLL